MNTKMIIKIIIDITMTMLLLALMAFNITGQKLHEVFGTSMFIIFIIHNILNYKWYKNIFHGRYSLFRIMQIIVNVSILISMICCMISGIMMSSYVFKFIPLNGNIILARDIHMASSYSGFVLMSIHLGMHWNMIINMINKNLVFRKLTYQNNIIKLVGFLIACYGAYSFINYDILSNMFLLNNFASFGVSKSKILFFIDYLSIMGFWIFISNYVCKVVNYL